MLKLSLFQIVFLCPHATLVLSRGKCLRHRTRYQQAPFGLTHTHTHTHSAHASEVFKTNFYFQFIDNLLLRLVLNQFYRPTLFKNVSRTLQRVFKLLFGSGFLNSWVHDHVIVLQELFAVQSSGSDTDSSLKNLRFVTFL